MQTKECTCCKQVLPLEAFSKQKLGKLGRTSKCKDCKTNLYARSIKGVIGSMYSNQRAKCKKRNHPAPAYTAQELYEYLHKNPTFLQLFNNWKMSGYLQDLKPSCDRLDDYKTYSFDNIQIVTFKENIQKFYVDIVNGKNTKRCCAVHQYDCDYKHINTFFSIREAERQTGVNAANITSACVKRLNRHSDGHTYTVKRAGGFFWEYAD
ncbi:MAG: hypothetical protein ACRC9H_06850 [Aeromonas veronii]